LDENMVSEVEVGLRFQTNPVPILSDSLPVGVPSPNVCCKCLIIHKANTEMNKLAGRKRLSLDYVGESYGIFATHLAEDNTNSSLRIESLYDSSHLVPASLPPFLDYIALPCTLLWKVFAQSSGA
jgi:hypothetical protein